MRILALIILLFVSFDANLFLCWRLGEARAERDADAAVAHDAVELANSNGVLAAIYRDAWLEAKQQRQTSL